MTLNSRRISRVVGLSTENEPASLPRTHCPDLKNVVIDKGGVCRTRDGYERLSTVAVKDSSWKFRGEFISATFFQEYWDGLRLPRNFDRFFYFTINLTLLESGALKRGPQSGNRMIVLHIGDPNAAFVQIWLDGTNDWKAAVTGGSGGQTVTVADSTLAIGSQRMLEFGYNLQSVDSEYTLRVIDVPNNTEVGQASTSSIGTPVGSGSKPAFIAAWPDTNGTQKLFDTTITGINVSTDEFGHFSCAEIRYEGLVDSSGEPTIQWTASNGMESRELRPEEYSVATVKGYWKCNDADRTFVRDYVDVTGNPDYTGANNPDHGRVLNVAPQWVSKANSVPADVSQNPDVTGNTITSLPTLHDYALLLAGQESLVYGRTGDRERFITGDPLVTLFSKAAASGDGWTLQLVFTPLMDRNETTYPDTTLYASSVNNTLALNPITIETVSDEFKLSFNDGTSVVTVTLTGENVSSFAGELVTLTAKRNNSGAGSLTFQATGENKSDSATASTAATSPAPATTVTSGPFMMFGNQIDTAVATTSPSSNSDDVLTLTGPTAHILLHEFRLWRIPLSPGRIIRNANVEVKPSSRADLVTYIKFNEGAGQQLTNSGTAATLTPTPITVGVATVKTNQTIFTRFFPADDTGPLPSSGMVKPFKPTKVRGAIDFRSIRDGKTSRQLMFVAGSTLYSFDMSTNTLTEQFGGVFKTDRPMDMVVFDDVLYMANGLDVLAWDGTQVRPAGIKAPVMRPSVTFANTGGTIDSGSYLLAYRYVNSDAGLRSNLSPLHQFTIGSGDLGTITKIHGIQVPTDPQVNAIEIFCTAEGDASAMYRLAVIEDVTFSSIVTTSGEWDNDGTPYDDLNTGSELDANVFILMPQPTASPVIEGQIHSFTQPPRTRALGILGSRILYASETEPGVIYFSRIDGGVQPEHVDTTPGTEDSLAINTDSGDRIEALVPFDDSVIAYMRDARAELSLTGLEGTDSTIVALPIQVEIRDHDLGTVSPHSVSNILGTHVFLSESDVYARSTRNLATGSRAVKNLTSPSDPPPNFEKPAKIGKFIRDLPADELLNAVVMHRQSHQQMWVAVTKENGPTGLLNDFNDNLLVYSFATKKWMRHTIDVDIMIEVETSSDRVLAIGFVDGYVVQLDDTGRTIDAYESSFTAGITTTVSGAQTGGSLYKHTLAKTDMTAGEHRFRTCWVGASGDFSRYLILDNSTSEVWLQPREGSTVSTSDTVYIGSIFPSIDFMVIPDGPMVMSRYRTVDMAASSDGMSGVLMNVWLNEHSRTPAVSSAYIQGAGSSPTNATTYFGKATLNGLARTMRFQLYGPAPGALLGLAELRFNYLPARKGLSHG